MNEKKFEFIEIKKSENLGVIIINRTQKFNSMSSRVFSELNTAFEEMKNDPEIEAVVLTGTGAFFSAGADVKEICGIALGGDLEKGKKLLENAHQTVKTIESLGKPVIAAINGICYGGGLEIAMACDYRVASTKAMFAQPEIDLNIMPGLGGTQRLPRLVGVGNALSMLFKGLRDVPALKAKEIGLVDEVVDSGQLIDKVKELIVRILNNKAPERKPATINLDEADNLPDDVILAMNEKSKPAVEKILKAVKEGINKPLDEAIELEKQLFIELVMTEEAKVGLAKKVGVDYPPKEKEKAEGIGSAVSGETGFTEEHEMLREMVRNFVKKELPFKKVKEMEEKEEIPKELIKKMGELGFYGAAFPEEYGGFGLGKRGYVILFEEIGRADASVAAFFGVHASLASNPIYLFGTEEQKQKYLVPAIKGEKIGAFGLTEPDAGSNVAATKTSAVKKGDKWIINGKKQFITNGPIADFVIIFAQTDPMGGSKTLVAFIVETSWKGFSVGKHEDKMGVRATQTVELILEGLEVPEENLLGQVGQGFKVAMTTLNFGRLGLAAGCLGGAKEARDRAIKYAAERIQFDNPLYMHQTIGNYIAEMEADIYLMESAVYRTAFEVDQGNDKKLPLTSAILKFQCSEMLEKIIRRAIQIHGGYGYMKEYELEKMLRDCIINSIWEGTNEIQRMMVLKEVLKEKLQ